MAGTRGTGDDAQPELDALRDRVAELEQEVEAVTMFRKFADASGQGLGMATLDGRIVYTNPTLSRITGTTNAKELANRRFTEYYTPRARERFQLEILPTLMESGEWVGELEIVSTTGEITRTLESFFLIRDDAGAPTHIAAVVTDITAQKETEDALRRLEAAVDQSIDGIAVADMSGTLQSVNPAWAKMHGYEPEEMVGQHLNMSHTQEQVERDVVPFTKHVMRDGAYRGDVGHVRRDGSEFPTWMTTTLLTNADGQPTGLIGIARDLTERRRIETQLRMTSKLEAIGTLAGGVAHDLNNALTTIITDVDRLARNPQIHQLAENELEEIRSSSDRASGLIRQLVAFAGQQRLQPMVIDVVALVERLSTLLRPMMGEDVRVDVRADPAGVGNIRADQHQVEQILMNLAANARDAMPRGGLFTIAIKDATLGQPTGLRSEIPPGSYVRIRVSDTGAGIAPENVERVFDPFFTTKDVGRGTGLGLASVHGTVRQHGGYIEASSEPGEGTALTIYMPRVSEAAKPEVVELSQPAPPGTEGILLAEDEALVRFATKRALEDLGYSVFDAASADAAQELFEQHAGRVDLLVSDVVMPGAGGPELYERLSALAPGLKVLYISGHTRHASGQSAGELGDHPLVTKPFAPATLARQIREVLDS